MSLVKFLNLLVLILILAAFYNLFFGIDSKRNFSVLQNENQELLVKNNTLAKIRDKIKIKSKIKKHKLKMKNEAET